MDSRSCPFSWPLAQGLTRPRLKGEQSKFWLEISRKRWQIRGWSPEHLHVGPTDFQLALSPLTLDDLEGSKIKVIFFHVKYVNNGNCYDVGPNGDYVDFPWASLCMTLKGYKSRSQSFHSKYLENGNRYEVGRLDNFFKVAMGFRLASSDLTFDDLQGSTIKVTLFDVTYASTATVTWTHRIHFVWPWEVKGQGHKQACDGNRYVGIYASPDNWRTCYPHMPIGMLGIYRLLFVFLFFLSAEFW